MFSSTGTAATSTACSWTYQFEDDRERSPSVLITAHCLSPADCKPVLATVVVKRRNSVTGQEDDVNESFAVACQPKPNIDQHTPVNYITPNDNATTVDHKNTDQYNPDDYTSNDYI